MPKHTGQSNAILQPAMDPRFAAWYLWARQIQALHPQDAFAQALIGVLRQWDDLQKRERAGRAVPANLMAKIEDSIVLLVQRLSKAYPEVRLQKVPDAPAAVTNLAGGATKVDP